MDSSPPRGRIEWTTRRTVEIGGRTLATSLAQDLAATLDAGHGQISGVRLDTGLRRLKRYLRPAERVWSWWLVNGFVVRRMGRSIRDCMRDDTVFLDVGCGNMPLARYIDPPRCYNAMDIAFSAYEVDRVFKSGRCVNLALASAYAIPVEPATVTLLTCDQVLTQTPEPGRILDEFRRVSRPGADVLIGFLNPHCRKYKVIGPHPDKINDWTLDGFTTFAAAHGLQCVRAEMMGRWIPLPQWLVRPRAYHLPLTSTREEDNTHLFFHLRA